MFVDRSGRRLGDADEQCPVCKTSSYLNKNIKFLVNPECYHRMCESCVDRIFSAGPAPCPIAGCKRTLRKARFRKQTFEDLSIEREVDIRKRVMRVLNRREEEFESLRAWNDFLQLREDIIMDLVDRRDVAKHEATLKQYETSNADSIRSNQLLNRREAEAFKTRQALEKERTRLRREVSRQEDEDERKERELEKSDIVNKLASGQTSVDDIVRVSKAKQKTGSRRRELQASEEKPVTPMEPLIKGLKEIKAPEPEQEYDPFMGMQFQRDWFELRQDYPLQRLTKAKKDKRVLAGGYDFSSYYDESLLKAFAGLGCFIEDEVAQRLEHTSETTGERGMDINTVKPADDVF